MEKEIEELRNKAFQAELHLSKLVANEDTSGISTYEIYRSLHDARRAFDVAKSTTTAQQITAPDPLQPIN